MLNVHSEIDMIADYSDPHAFLFGALRKTILSRDEFNRYGENYYFSEDKLVAMKTIQRCDMSMVEFIPEFHKDSIELTRPTDLFGVDSLVGYNFKELFLQILKNVEAQLDYSPKFIGSNQNDVLEFLPVLFKAFPDTKFISTIRDPRAGLNSILRRKPILSKEEILFTIQQWRKFVAFAYILQPDFITSYEQTVLEPEETLLKVCDYLELDYDSNMIDSANFIDAERGEKSLDTGIYTNTLDGWKNELQPKYVEIIEFMCGKEMESLGYKLTYDQTKPLGKEAATIFSSTQDLENEMLRHHIGTLNPNDVDPKVLEKHFLFKEVLKILNDKGV